MSHATSLATSQPSGNTSFVTSLATSAGYTFASAFGGLTSVDVGSVVAMSEPLIPLANASVEWPVSEHSTVVSDDSYRSVTIQRRSSESTFHLSDRDDTSENSYALYTRR